MKIHKKINFEVSPEATIMLQSTVKGQISISLIELEASPITLRLSVDEAKELERFSQGEEGLEAMIKTENGEIYQSIKKRQGGATLTFIQDERFVEVPLSEEESTAFSLNFRGFLMLA